MAVLLGAYPASHAAAKEEAPLALAHTLLPGGSGQHAFLQ